jgi:sugar O-acyltransferase (sialic acid O-acetyltransferase NeuD family)
MELIIIGAGNPTILRTIEDINRFHGCQNWIHVVGILDNNYRRLPPEILGIKVLGDFGEINKYPRSVHLANSVASSCKQRWLVTEYFLRLNKVFANVIHPSVNVEHVQIGTGNVVYESAMIHPCVSIGSHNVVSSCAGIAHDTEIDDNNFFGPKTYICGRVIIGSGNFFGVSSSVVPRVKIGDNCTIAACSLVMHDLKDNSLVKGIPAKEFKRYDVSSQPC